jgi:hypothetical protein
LLSGRPIYKRFKATPSALPMDANTDSMYKKGASAESLLKLLFYAVAIITAA